MRYANRADAGRRLARHLEHLRDTDPVVLGVPRGGVPVALEVARRLGAPLDLAVVRKLRVPWQPELGFGAVGEHGVRVLNQDVVRESGLGPAERETAERAARAELERRVRRWRGGRAPLPLTGRTAVVVSDSLATGAAVEAACRVARARGARSVVLAVPVGPEAALPYLRTVADRVVCPQPLRHPGSVGAWYEDFTPVTDAEVDAATATATAGAVPAGAAGAAGGGTAPEREVEVPAGPARLAALLTLPPMARALVVCAHGGCTGRHSPEERYVAEALQRAGLGTLLVDLLTEEEERDRHNVFDIVLLARRLHAAVTRLGRETGLPVGLCGAGTGSGAALAAAADDGVRAVVSLGGRPDLAGPAALARVRAPALFVVGALDIRMLGRNRVAADWMRCDHRVAVVPGAADVLADPASREAATALARDWFTAHLTRPEGVLRPRPLTTA
ncbi:phosphoribosyltransferase family protein [Streptomyces anandii]|uniref:phosphoribosyltransferase family protein n=1 Tax=Streptomyces anandii TaxID=285454 RepID=UPI00379CE71B